MNTNSPDMKNRKRFCYLGMVAVAMAMMPEVAAAAGGPIASTLNWVVTKLTTTWARSAAVIACAVMGYLAWIQRLEVRTVGFFILGCVFIFGAASVVDTFTSQAAGGWST